MRTGANAGGLDRDAVRIALAVQARVIGALMLREMRTRFGRSQLGYLWAIAEPLFYIVCLAYLFALMSRHAPFGPSVALFFATGLLPYQLHSRIASSLITAIDANEALLTYPIVKPLDTLIARAALEFATAATVVIILFAGLTVATDAPAPVAPHMMVLALVGLGLFAFGLGVINAVLAKLLPSWRQIYEVASRPLVLVSGVLFIPDSLPTAACDAIAFLPITHGVELFRSGYYMGYRSGILDIGFLFMTGLVACCLGLAAERVVRWRRP